MRRILFWSWNKDIKCSFFPPFFYRLPTKGYVHLCNLWISFSKCKYIRGFTCWVVSSSSSSHHVVPVGTQGRHVLEPTLSVSWHRLGYTPTLCWLIHNCLMIQWANSFSLLSWTAKIESRVQWIHLPDLSEKLIIAEIIIIIRQHFSVLWI